MNKNTLILLSLSLAAVNISAMEKEVCTLDDYRKVGVWTGNEPTDPPVTTKKTIDLDSYTISIKTVNSVIKLHSDAFRLDFSGCNDVDDSEVLDKIDWKSFKQLVKLDLSNKLLPKDDSATKKKITKLFTVCPTLDEIIRQGDMTIFRREDFIKPSWKK